MLEPQDRRMLLDLLRPPPGYELDFAIGTTYSLDLLAMLTAPLGFTLHGLEGSAAEVLESGDALLLLETLRRYANRIGLFCQAGRIAEPKGRHLLFSMLEQSVVEVTPPTRGGVFHPKVWVLRYQGDEGVAYRTLVLSRNLTFDRSWDTAVVLDGLLMDRKVGYSRNKPLADFVAALPAMAVRQPVPTRITEMVTRAADELRRVDFELPLGFDDLAFWPMGLAGRRLDPFRDADVRRLMVISPFLSKGTLDELGTKGDKDRVLISRFDTLQQFPKKDFTSWKALFALSNYAAFEEEHAAEDSAPIPAAPTAREVAGDITGLHAKVYVGDAGWDASIWTGSTNATTAGFERNVEFLVQLTGKKSLCGVDALLARTEGTIALRDLIEQFEPLIDPIVPDPALENLECVLDEARLSLAERRWRVTLVQEGDAGHAMRVSAEGGPISLPDAVEVTAWPISLPSTAGQALDPANPSLDFGVVAFETITSFVAFELSASQGEHVARARFVVNAALEGAPAGRSDKLLQCMLRDRRQVVRFLLMLLAGDEEQNIGIGNGGLPPLPGAGAARWESSALLEPLLRALHREPHRLDAVRGVIEALSNGGDGAQLLPEDFDRVWQPIWAARESLKG